MAWFKPHVAPEYDPERSTTPDNEYLHYINYKLAYANSLLAYIRILLWGIFFALLAIVDAVNPNWWKFW